MISEQIRKGNSLLRKKDYDASITEYKLAGQMKTQSQFFIDVIVNSLRGYNCFCLLQYQQAQKWYNKALESNPFDSASLVRRATLFMKIKSYQKAAVDIIRLSQIEPQSIRIAALVMQLKDKSMQSWKQQIQNDPFRSQKLDDLDEEDALNFSTVRQIDRISLKVNKPGRISQINFGKDEKIEYEQFQDEVQNAISQKVASKDKFELMQLQLNSLQSDVDQSIPKFVTSKITKKPKKSILKCSIAYRIPTDIVSQILPAKDSSPSINAIKIKDIDGKIIESSKQIRFSVSCKSEVSKPNPESRPRKSCMKNASMIVNSGSSTIHTSRSSNSRFSFGDLKNLEGKIPQKKSLKGGDSSGDESDEYNIFGNKEPSHINEQLEKIQSYVSQDEDSSNTGDKFKPKKSILKCKVQIQNSEQKQKSGVSLNKKSVLFK